jgi:hypothetical protein
MCLTSLGEIAEFYPKVEENPAVSWFFFHETAIFHDPEPPGIMGRPRPEPPRPNRRLPSRP